MRSKHKADHVNQRRSLKNEVRFASGKVGRVVLAFALVFLLFPASSPALAATSDQGVDGDAEVEATADSATEEVAEEDEPDALAEEAAEEEEESSDAAAEEVAEEEGSDDSAEEVTPTDAFDETAVKAAPKEKSSSTRSSRSARTKLNAPSESPDMPSIEITVTKKGSDEPLSPYDEQDTTIYSASRATLSVNIGNLETGDKIEFTGTGFYEDGLSEELQNDTAVAWGESVGKELDASIDIADQASGSIAIKVTRGENVIEKKFSNKVVVDKAAPKLIGDFEMKLVDGSGEETAVVVSEAKIPESVDPSEQKDEKFFNLDNDGTAQKLELTAIVEEANPAEEIVSLKDLDGNEVLPANRLESAWSEVADSDGKRQKLTLTLDATDFLDASKSAVRPLQAYVEVTDKLDRTLDGGRQYPKAQTAEGDDYVFSADSCFSAENALLAGVTATPKFGEAKPRTKDSDSALYFNGPVTMSAIVFDEDSEGSLAALADKGTENESTDYVMTVDGVTYDLGKQMSDYELTNVGVDFDKDPGQLKKYEDMKLRVTSAHGATRTIALPDIAISDIKSSVSFSLDKGSQKSQKAIISGGDEAEEFVFGSADDLTLDVSLKGADFLTSKKDVVVGFIDEDGRKVDVAGDEDTSSAKFVWESDSADDNGTWTGTLEIMASSEDSAKFKAGKGYRIEFVKAKSFFDEGDSSTWSVSAEKDGNDDIVQFLVDTFNPFVSIGFKGAKLTDPNTDLSKSVVAIINSVMTGEVTVTVVDKSMVLDGDSSTITLKNRQTSREVVATEGGLWGVVKNEDGDLIADTYSYTIPYSSSLFTEGDVELSVHAVDLAGNETNYGYGASDDETGNTTKVNGEDYGSRGDWKDAISVDNTSVEFVGLSFYGDEGCTAELTSETGSDGVAYYDEEAVYVKVRVKDANFAKLDSVVSVYCGGELDNNQTPEEVVWQEEDEGVADGEGKVTYATVLKLAAGEKYELKIEANDLAGNDTSIFGHSGNGIDGNLFSVDSNFPNITMIISEEPLDSVMVGGVSTDIYPNAIMVTVIAEDSQLDLNSLSFKVSEKGGTWSQVVRSDDGDDWESEGELEDARKSQLQTTLYDVAPADSTDEGIELGGDAAAAVYTIEVEASDAQGHKTIYRYGDSGTYEESAGNESAPVRKGGALSTKVVKPDDTEGTTTNGQFAVDTQVPEVDVVMGGKGKFVQRSKGENEGDGEGIDYYNAAVQADITVTDQYFDASQAKVTDESGSELALSSGWKLVEDTTDQWTASIKFNSETEAGKSHGLNVSAPDYGGHETAYKYGDNVSKEKEGNGPRSTKATSTKDESVKVTGSGFVVDSMAPSVDSVTFDRTFVGSRNNVDYYTHIDSLDAAGDEKIITATIVVADNHFDQSTKIEKGTIVPDGRGKTWTNVTGEDDVVAKWAASVKFDETAVDSTSSLGTVTLVDLAGWKTTYEGKDFVYDNTRPEIGVADKPKPTWNEKTAEGEIVNYYAVMPTFAVTVTDRNFDSNGENSKLTASGATGNHPSWGKVEGGGENWRAEVKFSDNTEDAPLSNLSVTAVDEIYTLANENPQLQTNADALEVVRQKHRKDWLYSDSYPSAKGFVTDSVDPVVTIETNSVPTGVSGSPKVDYYKGPVTATITVKDRHFSKDAKISKDGESVSLGEWVPSKSNPKDGEEVSWTNSVSFDSEGLHKLSVTAFDKAKRSGTASYASASPNNAKSFVIDMTDPAVAIEINKAKQDSDAKGVDYFKSALTATVIVVDDNFDTGSRLIVDGSRLQEVRWANPSEDGKTWLAEIDYAEGNKHTLSIQAKDLSTRQTRASYGDPKGNVGKASVRGTVDSRGRALTGKSFTIDETKPVVSYNVNQLKSATHDSIDYFSNIVSGDRNAVITVKVKEINFNRKSTLNVVTKNGTRQRQVQWKKRAGNTWTTAVSFDEGAGNVLDVAVADWSRNVSTLKYGRSTTAVDGAELTSSSFTVDLTAPVIENVSVDGNYSGNYGDELYFFDRPTKLTVMVTDNLGLRSVQLADKDGYYSKSYYVASDAKPGAKKQSVVVEFAEGEEFDRDITLETVDLAYNSRTWSIAPDGEVSDVTGSSRKNASFKEDSHPQSLVLDLTNPELEFSGVSAGTYYNSAQTVVLNVKELNFRYLKSSNVDSGKSLITVDKRPGNAEGANSSWSVPISSFDVVNEGQRPSGLDGLYRYSEAFASDGHYSLSASLEDPAGHSASARQDEFTIDMTAPTVDVSWDNGNAVNGNYYGASRTATVTITEHNFDPRLINIETTGSVGSWSNVGDRHMISVMFGLDGIHDLTVSGKDLAGNALSEFRASQFVIDKTSPTVKISFANSADPNQRAFNDIVQPVISFADEANYDSAGATFTLRGNKVGDVSYDFSRVAEGNGETVTFADFAHAINVDDIYTLTASVTDKAGNKAAEATETFSVNRFGSNYVVVSPTAEGDNAADLGYLDAAPEIVIREINVAGVDESSVAVTHDLKTTNLERQSSGGRAGYTVRDDSASAEYGWQEYEYTIAKESFKSESAEESPDGNYSVILSSHDVTGNTNSSANFWVSTEDARKSANATISEAAGGEDATEKSMSAAVKFTLDTTPPEILGLSVENGSVINAPDGEEVSFIVTDNLGIDEREGVSVFVDEQPVGHQVSPEGGGRMSFVVPEKAFADQRIEIVAKDLATNGSTLGGDADGDLTGPFSIRVTSNPIDLYMPVIVGGALAAAVLVGTGAVLFVRHRRRKPSKN